MRRPPIACQRAVQSLQSPAPQHIWVPDEVLSLAVHRFFYSTCPQQRRHGSNVPGPLEARKRAAKRRMTASAGYYPQDSFPTLFSLGALFGYRSNPQTSWRYEPPSLPRNLPGVSSFSPAWDDTPSADAQSRCSAIDPNSADRNLPQALTHQSAQLADKYESSGAIDMLSWDLPTTEPACISRNELERSLDSFKAGFAAAQSGSSTPVVEGLLKGLFERNLPSTLYLCQYSSAVLQHLDSAGGSPVPVLRVLLEDDGRLLRVLNPLQRPSDCAAFMDSLDMVWETEHKRRKPFVHRVLRIMAQSATEAGKSTTEAQDCILLHLIERMGNRVPHTELKTLHRLALNLSESAENNLLLSHFDETKRVQEVVLSTVRNVAAAPDGFAGAERALSYMPRHQLLSVVPAITLRLAKRITSHNMETWLRLVHQVDGKGDTGKMLLDAALSSLAGTLGVHGNGKWSPYPDSPKYFVKAVLLCRGIDLQIQHSARTLPRVQNAVADVLVQLQAQPKAYTAFIDLALLLVARHAGSATLLRCLRTMEEKGLPLSTQIDFASIIVDELAELQLPTTSLSKPQARERALTLQACKRLIKALSRVGYALPAMTEEVRQFQNVLVHARANHALPIDRRNAATDLPLIERIVLVHQLAHHYSKDTSLTQRAAWRCVYYLYKYLESNSLPLGPLFTKSVTQVSITRPLMENRFISARRLIWVCHLVARVEGDAVAARLENTFHRQRGDIIGRAKDTYIGVGGSKHSKAHVGSMKRLGI
ncbi:uncharacterized protein M421DRAFT_420292, partial [Didymella exigua CBS 183.55]